MPKYTIYDIAKKANVSISTVSRVLNNSSSVKEETRLRVQNVLNEYHYTPDATARSLATQCTKMIGIFISDDSIQTAAHADAVRIIVREMAKHSYACLINNLTTKEAEQANYIKEAKQRNIDGLILVGSFFQTQFIQRMIQRYFSEKPVIVMNGYIDLPNVYCIIADEREGVLDCVNLFAHEGIDKLAFIANKNKQSNKEKITGFREGVLHCFGERSPIVVYARDEKMAGYKITRELLADHQEIKGIVYSDDYLAFSGLRAINELGLSVPGDIAIMGIGNSLIAQYSAPVLTTLDTKLNEMSIIAADKFFSIQRKEKVDRVTHIPLEIQRGKSL